MAYRQHQMTALIALNPGVARARIRSAFAGSASVTDAAIALGCSYVTLYRWIKKLGLQVRALQTPRAR